LKLDLDKLREMIDEVAKDRNLTFVAVIAGHKRGGVSVQIVPGQYCLSNQSEARQMHLASTSLKGKYRALFGRAPDPDEGHGAGDADLQEEIGVVLGYYELLVGVLLVTEQSSLTQYETWSMLRTVFPSARSGDVQRGLIGRVVTGLVKKGLAEEIDVDDPTSRATRGYVATRQLGEILTGQLTERAGTIGRERYGRDLEMLADLLNAAEVLGEPALPRALLNRRRQVLEDIAHAPPVDPDTGRYGLLADRARRMRALHEMSILDGWDDRIPDTDHRTGGP
jgi:hypothetical protein